MNDFLNRFKTLQREEYAKLIDISCDYDEKNQSFAAKSELYSLVIKLTLEYCNHVDFLSQRKTLFSILLNLTDRSIEFSLTLANTQMVMSELMDSLKRPLSSELDPQSRFSYLIVGIFYNMSKHDNEQIKDSLIHIGIHNFEFKKDDQRKYNPHILPLLLLLKINISLNKYPLFVGPIIVYFEEILGKLHSHNDFIAEGLSIKEIYRGLSNLLANNSFLDEVNHLNLVRESILLLARLPEKHESVKLVVDYLKMVTINNDCRSIALDHLQQNPAKNVEPLRKFLTESSLKRKEEDFDVMLSYTHRDREIVDKVAFHLTMHKIRIWKDDQQMHGSDDLLDSISYAVEKSKVILIFFSSEYQKSVHTKAEAQYAYKLKKNIIYLRVEKGFNPTGWLGIMLSTRIYIDISGKYPLEDKIQELLWTLGNKSDTRNCPKEETSSPTKQHPEDIYKPTSKLIFQEGISAQNYKIDRLSRELMALNLDNVSETEINLISRLRFTEKNIYLNYILGGFQAETALDIISKVTHIAGNIASESEDYTFEGC